MSNISVRKNSGEYRPGDKGVFADDLNYLLSKAGNSTDYIAPTPVGLDRDKTWTMEYSNSEEILLNLGFVWRNGKLCKQVDEYQGTLSQQTGDALNFVRVLESNVPVAMPTEESTFCTAGLTGSSAIWYVLMLSNDAPENANADYWATWLSYTQLKNPAVSPNKYHVLRYTRDQIGDIYSGLPTHIDSCKKIIGCANFTEDGKLINIFNSFLKGHIKEEFTPKPFDLIYYDKLGTISSSGYAEVYIRNSRIKDNTTGKQIYPYDFINSGDLFGSGGLSLAQMTSDKTNYIYVEYNPLGDSEEASSEAEYDGLQGTAEIKCVDEDELEAYLLENPEYDKRLLWTIKIEGPYNDVHSFTRHLDEDIYISSGGAGKKMPWDCSLATVTISETDYDVITVRNGGFYLREVGGYQNFKFVGNSVEGFGGITTIYDLTDYDIDKIAYLDRPEEPTEEVLEDVKYIIWAGYSDYWDTVSNECFVDITLADEIPDRSTLILTPIAEFIWKYDSTGPWTYELNQLKRGFIHDEYEELFQFKFRIKDYQIQCYLTNTSDAYFLNGDYITNHSETFTVDSPDNLYWWKLRNISVPTSAITIYAILRKPTHSSGQDISNFFGTCWDFATSGGSDNYEAAIPLVTIAPDDVTGIGYTFEYYRKGLITRELAFTDTKQKKICAGFDTVNQRSIERREGSYGTEGVLQLYKFDNQPNITEVISDIAFVISETTGESPEVQQVAYLPMADLLEYLDIPEPQTCEDFAECMPEWLDDYFWDWFCTELGEEYDPPESAPWWCLFENLEHGKLADIVGGVGTDDHVDSTRDSTYGKGTNVSYLNLDGDAGRNAFSESAYIGDKTGYISIAPNDRILADSAQWYSVDWGNRLLVAPNNLIIAEWSDGGFNVMGGTYGHNYVGGVTITNWTGGGIVTGADIVEISAIDLLDTDKILVIRA